MGVVDPDSFLAELLSLFESVREKKTIYVTLKRVKPKGENTSCCLVRAKTAKRKLSTTVRGDGAANFYARLSDILDASITSLPKREKEGKKGAKGSGGRKKSASAAAAQDAMDVTT